MTKRQSFLSNLFKGIGLKSKKIFNNPYSKVNINWFSLKYLKHLPPNKMHSHRLFGHPTFFYGGPEYLHGLNEIFIGDIYKQQLPENAYILDCGAHIGLSVIYLKNICPTANIVAFEPDEQNYLLLKKNIASHHLNISARQQAVWIEDTDLQFLQEGNMSSKITSNSINTKIVEAIRLKNLISQKVDFLKLDIEGAEYEVIKDIAENLYQVSKMFVEYHGTFAQNIELLEIFEIISNAGFNFYIKEAAVNYPEPFLRKQKNQGYDVQLNIFCFRGEK